MKPTAPAPTSLEVAQTRTHHKFGPSRMNYLDECAGFTPVNGTSDAAEQGTFLHDLMQQMTEAVAKKKYPLLTEQINGWLTARHELTEEELDYLRFACLRVDYWLARKPSNILTEINVSTHDDNGTELNHGYLDVLLVFGDVGVLIDFKFGWLPVKPASANLQGYNYALGVFQKYRALNKIGVEFVQPKLNWVSSHVFQRAQMSELYHRLAEVVARAKMVQSPRPGDKPQQYMKAGPYCDYCAHKGDCAVLAKTRGMAVARYQDMPLPKSFSVLKLRRPEDVALARYWVDVVESGLDEVKKHAKEVAENNGGSISCVLPNGEQITYEIGERNVPRSLGSALEVSEALKEIVSPEEILGAADLALTKLEPICKNAVVELERAKGNKITKKAAWERITDTLTALGLLSEPDHKIRFLKLKKQTKQLKEEKSVQQIGE